VEQLLKAHGGDVQWVPAIWYAGSAGAQRGWDYIPGQSYGNSKTIRQYVQSWIDEFNSLAGQHHADASGGTPGVQHAALSLSSVAGKEGSVESPRQRLKWFIQQALEVRAQRVAAGQADFGRD